jgi:hypothetical protein
MDQTSNTAGLLYNPPAFIFTNSQGIVFFSDLNFIRTLGIQPDQIISGRTLSNILIMDPRTEGQLIESVRQKARIEEFPVLFRSASGNDIQSTGTAVAALDENRNFLGMDLVLMNHQGSSQSVETTPPILTHNDVLKAYVEKEMNPRTAEPPRTFIQSYLVAQFNAVQILLARIGGPGPRLAFEKVANQTASSMGLPINMESGHLYFFGKDINILGYRNILQATMNYAVNVVGKNTVKKEMLQVDKYVGQGTLELISQMDLRIFFAE